MYRYDTKFSLMHCSQSTTHFHLLGKMNKYSTVMISTERIQKRILTDLFFFNIDVHISLI